MLMSDMSSSNEQMTLLRAIMWSVWHDMMTELKRLPAKRDVDAMLLSILADNLRRWPSI